MAYDRVNWEDAPSTKTPISAENLNKMDAGILANDKKLQKAISIKQEVDDSAQNIDSTLMESLPAATAAEDADILIIENATKTQKITWGTILNLIKAKLGIGTAANLQTTSKEIVGAVNELNSNIQFETSSLSLTKGSVCDNYGIIRMRRFGKVIELDFTTVNITGAGTLFTGLPEKYRPPVGTSVLGKLHYSGSYDYGTSVAISINDDGSITTEKAQNWGWHKGTITYVSR